MRLHEKVHRIIFRLLSLSIVALCCGAASLPAQLSTDDHLAEPGFWPTKSAKSLAEFAGSAACAECHQTIAASQFQTSMAKGLLRAEESKLLDSPVPLQFTRGEFRYEIAKVSGKVLYSAAGQSQKRTAELRWAFGTGRVAQSYLFKESDGGYHEARVTFFSSLKNLHITPAREISAPQSLSEAMERRVPDSEIRRCFACHSTQAIVNDRFDETKLVPGVACEACHGPGAKHVAAMQAAKLSGVAATRGEYIFNPARLGAADAVDFCGGCHGAFWDIKLSGVKGVGNVRAQPYRLESSKCWGTGDARLRCAACHDPHKEVRSDAAAYDGACLSCHRASSAQAADAQHAAKACPTAAKNCTTCHMPKIEIPFMHDTFTDHKIQIAKAGQSYVE
jgi:hypothetical protein